MHITINGQPLVQFVLIFLVVVACYFVGNINFAKIIARAKKIDITKQGSGNPGTMNMARTLGTRWGFVTLALDAAKGAFGAVLGWYVLCFGRFAPQLFSFGDDLIGMLIGGASVVIGHIFPIIYKFKGGKGVASTIGVCMVLNPIVTLISFVAAVTFIVFFKFGTIASFITLTPPIALFTYRIATAVDAYGYFYAPAMTRLVAPILCVLLFLLVLFMHRTNLKRMFNGTENVVNALKKKQKKQKQKQTQKA